MRTTSFLKQVNSEKKIFELGCNAYFTPVCRLVWFYIYGRLRPSLSLMYPRDWAQSVISQGVTKILLRRLITWNLLFDACTNSSQVIHNLLYICMSCTVHAYSGTRFELRDTAGNAIANTHSLYNVASHTGTSLLCRKGFTWYLSNGSRTCPRIYAVCISLVQ